MQLSPKPYKLNNKIQNYGWGTKNNEAFIPKLLGFDAEKELPYAELWIGAHPKAPSEINLGGKQVDLNKLNIKLPFLLKVLSASKALSIQTHPNKEQAIKLHAIDPKNYPDDNHKPEIAIAIDSLSALVGFRPIEEIISMLRKRKEIGKYFGEEIVEKISSLIEVEKDIIGLFQIIMKSSSDEELLKNSIEEIKNNLTIEQSLTIQEKFFLEQYKEYGNDVGLFSILFMNVVDLKPGQAIFTGAGIPHAYLKGNIVECMANSDNVVRAGLTPKFKDVNTLLGILKYDFHKPQIIENKSSSNQFLYNCEAKEFSISSYDIEKEEELEFSNNEKAKIILILSGSINLSWGKGNIENYKRGDSILIPDSLDSFEIRCEEKSLFFITE